MLNDFKNIQYKKLNLILADSIEDLCYSGDKLYVNIVKSLRFCSQHSILEKNQENDYNIFTNSLSCKNKYCFICNYRKSIRYTQRFENLLNDPQYKNYFLKKHFYFCTLTLKHNHNERNYIYLKELNQYQNKLFRSRTWSKHFGSKDQKHDNSYITSTEITFTPNLYNIHTHILIIADPLKVPINDLQQQIQLQWLLITKDSWNVRLDLIKQKDNQNFNKTLREVFKYNVKINLKNLKNKQVSYQLGDWIDKSHKAKLIRVHGHLKSTNLFSRSSKYDSKQGSKFIDYSNSYFLTHQSKIKFSENIKLTEKIDNKLLSEKNIKILPDISQMIEITNDVESYISKIKTKEYYSNLKNMTLIDSKNIIENQKLEDQKINTLLQSGNDIISLTKTLIDSNNLPNNLF